MFLENNFLFLKTETCILVIMSNNPLISTFRAVGFWYSCLIFLFCNPHAVFRWKYLLCSIMDIVLCHYSRKLRFTAEYELYLFLFFFSLFVYVSYTSSYLMPSWLTFGLVCVKISTPLNYLVLIRIWALPVLLLLLLFSLSLILFFLHLCCYIKYVI